MPSSFGLTFLVTEDVKTLLCDVSFATYRRAKFDDCRIPFHPDNPESYCVPSQLDAYVFYDDKEGCLKLRSGINRKTISELRSKDLFDGEEFGIFSCMYKLSDQLRGGYVRIPHSTAVIVDFSQGNYVDNNKNIDGTRAKITALKRCVGPGLYSITVMMVNDDEGKSNGTRCIFQPVLTVDSKKNDFCFREYAVLTDFSRLDQEEQSLELQYRNKKVYGTGLGTSVNWEIDLNGNGVLYNDFFPETEVPSMDFSVPEDSGIDKHVLSMRYLSDIDLSKREEKITGLQCVLDAYGNWIRKLKEKETGLEEKYLVAANKNIAGCERALSRMEAGIDILLTNEKAWNAFELANRAMFMQRIHLSIQEKMSNVDRFPGDEELSTLLENIDYADDSGLAGDNHYWRLFQIAFLLMSIKSIVEDTSSERELVDLIWFPTGGGKTEAYLGLTAFTIFYRRLAHIKESGGTTVIMRYTLRLLAAQQFILGGIEYSSDERSILGVTVASDTGEPKVDKENEYRRFKKWMEDIIKYDLPEEIPGIWVLMFHDKGAWKLQPYLMKYFYIDDFESGCCDFTECVDDNHIHTILPFISREMNNDWRQASFDLMDLLDRYKKEPDNKMNKIQSIILGINKGTQLIHLCDLYRDRQWEPDCGD